MNHVRLAIALFATAVGSAHAQQNTGRADHGAALSEVACAALEGAVDSLVPRGAGERLALAEHTQPIRGADAARSLGANPRDIPGLDTTTWASFVANNRERHPACRTLPSGAEVVLVSDSTVSALRASSGSNPDSYWRAFYTRFPQTRGLTVVSGIGVSADGRQALLSLTHTCGGLCGRGYMVLLERRDGGSWRVTRARLDWMS